MGRSDAQSQLNLPPVEVNSRDRHDQSVAAGGQCELTTLLAESVTAAGCSDKEAAYAQGIDPAHWSRIRSGEKRAHLDRVGRLPMRVQQEFVRRYGKRLQLRVVEEDTQRRALLDLVEAATRALKEIP